MSKSFLIIDTPQNCAKCPIKSQLHDIHYICCGNHRRMTIPGATDKPDWCPLKEVPERKKLGEFVSAMEDMKVVGYNACLDEILS